MKKIFVGNLPPDSSEEEVTALFAQHGRVRSIHLGFGFVEMEGHEARAAIAALNGTHLRTNQLKVNEERPKPGGRRGGRRH